MCFNWSWLLHCHFKHSLCEKNCAYYAGWPSTSVAYLHEVYWLMGFHPFSCCSKRSAKQLSHSRARISIYESVVFVCTSEPIFSDSHGYGLCTMDLPHLSTGLLSLFFVIDYGSFVFLQFCKQVGTSNLSGMPLVLDYAGGFFQSVEHYYVFTEILVLLPHVFFPFSWALPCLLRGICLFCSWELRFSPASDRNFSCFGFRSEIFIIWMILSFQGADQNFLRPWSAKSPNLFFEGKVLNLA